MGIDAGIMIAFFIGGVVAVAAFLPSVLMGLFALFSEITNLIWNLTMQLGTAKYFNFIMGKQILTDNGNAVTDVLNNLFSFLSPDNPLSTLTTIFLSLSAIIAFSYLIWYLVSKTMLWNFVEKQEAAGTLRKTPTMYFNQIIKWICFSFIFIVLFPFIVVLFQLLNALIIEMMNSLYSLEKNGIQTINNTPDAVWYFNQQYAYFLEIQNFVNAIKDSVAGKVVTNNSTEEKKWVGEMFDKMYYFNIPLFKNIESIQTTDEGYYFGFGSMLKALSKLTNIASLSDTRNFLTLIFGANANWSGVTDYNTILQDSLNNYYKVYDAVMSNQVNSSIEASNYTSLTTTNKMQLNSVISNFFSSSNLKSIQDSFTKDTWTSLMGTDGYDVASNSLITLIGLTQKNQKGEWTTVDFTYDKDGNLETYNWITDTVLINHFNTLTQKLIYTTTADYNALKSPEWNAILSGQQNAFTFDWTNIDTTQSNAMKEAWKTNVVDNNNILFADKFSWMKLVGYTNLVFVKNQTDSTVTTDNFVIWYNSQLKTVFANQSQIAGMFGFYKMFIPTLSITANSSTAIDTNTNIGIFSSNSIFVSNYIGSSQTASGIALGFNAGKDAWKTDATWTNYFTQINSTTYATTGTLNDSVSIKYIKPNGINEDKVDLFNDSPIVLFVNQYFRSPSDWEGYVPLLVNPIGFVVTAIAIGVLSVWVKKTVGLTIILLKVCFDVILDFFFVLCHGVLAAFKENNENNEKGFWEHIKKIIVAMLRPAVIFFAFMIITFILDSAQNVSYLGLGFTGNGDTIRKAGWGSLNKDMILNAVVMMFFVVIAIYTLNSFPSKVQQIFLQTDEGIPEVAGQLGSEFNQIWAEGIQYVKVVGSALFIAGGIAGAAGFSIAKNHRQAKAEALKNNPEGKTYKQIKKDQKNAYKNMKKDIENKTNKKMKGVINKQEKKQLKKDHKKQIKDLKKTRGGVVGSIRAGNREMRSKIFGKEGMLRNENSIFNKSFNGFRKDFKGASFGGLNFGKYLLGGFDIAYAATRAGVTWIQALKEEKRLVKEAAEQNVSVQNNLGGQTKEAQNQKEIAKAESSFYETPPGADGSPGKLLPEDKMKEAYNKLTPEQKEVYKSSGIDEKNIYKATQEKHASKILSDTVNQCVSNNTPLAKADMERKLQDAGISNEVIKNTLGKNGANLWNTNNKVASVDTLSKQQERLKVNANKQANFEHYQKERSEQLNHPDIIKNYNGDPDNYRQQSNQLEKAVQNGTKEAVEECKDILKQKGISVTNADMEHITNIVDTDLKRNIAIENATDDYSTACIGAKMNEYVNSIPAPSPYEIEEKRKELVEQQKIDNKERFSGDAGLNNYAEAIGVSLSQDGKTNKISATDRTILETIQKTDNLKAIEQQMTNVYATDPVGIQRCVVDKSIYDDFKGVDVNLAYQSSSNINYISKRDFNDAKDDNVRIKANEVFSKTNMYDVQQIFNDRNTITDTLSQEGVVKTSITMDNTRDDYEITMYSLEKFGVYVPEVSRTKPDGTTEKMHFIDMEMSVDIDSKTGSPNVMFAYPTNKFDSNGNREKEWVKYENGEIIANRNMNPTEQYLLQKLIKEQMMSALLNKFDSNTIVKEAGKQHYYNDPTDTEQQRAMNNKYQDKIGNEIRLATNKMNAKNNKPKRNEDNTQQ